LTLCGKYSLIGGVSVGIQSAKLNRFFNNLDVHTNVDMIFTFMAIDQDTDVENMYQVYIDNKLVK
jgi:hypothetical protein